ncbi:MAG: hypothetical protein N3B12_02465 [Armatimonadetes bacterium]|nr:hypothetical protein [Armatimonadota bacterium]
MLKKTTKPEFWPGYPYLKHANVLVENEVNLKTVYLPKYGFEAIDRVAISAWQKVGCRVVPVRGFAISAMYGGSLRCCAKVIRRN